MEQDRLARQLAFIAEMDCLKSVLRQTSLVGGERRENTAEHSWHLALMAVVLGEYADAAVDLRRVVLMVVVHDLVEVDAGDTFCYDAAGNDTKRQRELAAAERIFGLLPPEQGLELRTLWEEFEAATTPDAHFANALDRLQPLMLNWHNGGGTWTAHSVSRRAVMARMEPVRHGTPAIWPYVIRVVDSAVAAGWIVPDE